MLVLASPRVRFICLSVLYGVVLYAALLWLAPSSGFRWALGSAVAAIAVMLAAQGIPWKSKVLFAAVTATLSVLVFEVVTHSFLGDAVDAANASAVVAATDWQLAAFVAVQVLRLGVPLAALALFVGRRPSRLWSRG